MEETACQSKEHFFLPWHNVPLVGQDVLIIEDSWSNWVDTKKDKTVRNQITTKKITQITSTKNKEKEKHLKSRKNKSTTKKSEKTQRGQKSQKIKKP